MCGDYEFITVRSKWYVTICIGAKQSVQTLHLSYRMLPMFVLLGPPSALSNTSLSQRTSSTQNI